MTMSEFAATELSVSDFVALHNRVLEYALPNVTIVGELANFRVSKNRWVYFDLKDETASVRFFGTVYQLSGPLEDGMLLKVQGVPRLHPQFGFSITVQSIRPAGEGSLKKAADLLEAQLRKEGLFALERKRPLPYPPERVGLITSGESAAYADFMKILNTRWQGMSITLADVQVQGEVAPEQIVRAIANFNALPEPPEVLVITRGGGSTDDLWAFSTEQVTRAVAASRIPTLVAIGHEVDTSLAELAADQRASTPSNAAELLTPDKKQVRRDLQARHGELDRQLRQTLQLCRRQVAEHRIELSKTTVQALTGHRQRLLSQRQLLAVLDPVATLRRGYAIVRDTAAGTIVRRVQAVQPGQHLTVRLADGEFKTKVE
jgi:exodeoxyribonuclease VII large subunit